MSLTRMTRAAALAAALTLVSLATAHASGEWEHSAVYDIVHDDEPFSLNLGNPGETTTMKFCFAVTDELSAHGVHEVEDSCHADDDDVISIAPSDTAVQIVSGTTYELTLDPDSWFSVFNVQFPSPGAFAFFAEHDLGEFHIEGGTEMALLKDPETHDVEPAWGGPDSTTTSTTRATPWKNTMLGCFAVWCVTVSGVVLVINNSFWQVVKPYALMFASGTLLSTAFALVLFESTHLIMTDEGEGLAAGRWTAMIMCGFITSPFIALVLRHFLPVDEEGLGESANAGDTVKGGSTLKDLEAAKFTADACCSVPATVDGSPQNAVDCEKSITNANVRYRFLLSLIVGDFFHNFTDGVFIGAAFACSESLAWKIVMVTVGHEIPQELADFAVLTNSLGFSTKKALAYNVISGVSVMLGGIAIMAAEVSNLDNGMLLAYGAGNYLYCATVHMFSQGSKDRFFDAKKLLVFAVGALAIGLILLDHEHCAAPAVEGAASEAADPHAGHGH